MSKIVMALDQGTTSSRTILFSEKGEIVADADKENLQLHELSLDKLKKRCKLIEEDVFECLMPENALKLRDSKGGTSPKEVLRQIKRIERDLKKRVI